MQHHIYILLCSDNSLYTGYTNNIEKRLETHKGGKGSKYVRSRLPFKHIYTESFDSKQEAMSREYEIKKWNRQKKIKQLGLTV